MPTRAASSVAAAVALSAATLMWAGHAGASASRGAATCMYLDAQGHRIDVQRCTITDYADMHGQLIAYDMADKRTYSEEVTDQDELGRATRLHSNYTGIVGPFKQVGPLSCAPLASGLRVCAIVKLSDL
jgi:hypothetical protein